MKAIGGYTGTQTHQRKISAVRVVPVISSLEQNPPQPKKYGTLTIHTPEGVRYILTMIRASLIGRKNYVE